MTFDAHLPAPHRMAPYFTATRVGICLARQPELALEVLLRFRARRKMLEPSHDLDHALLAFALLAARCRHLYFQACSHVKETHSGRCFGGTSVDGERHSHF